MQFRIKLVKPAGCTTPGLEVLLNLSRLKLGTASPLVYVGYTVVQVSWISYEPLHLSEVVELSTVSAGIVLGFAQVGGTLGRVGFGVPWDRVDFAGEARHRGAVLTAPPT